ESNCIDRCGMGNRANEVTSGKRVDRHNVAASDRGTVSSGSHRGNRGQEVTIDLRHTRQLGKKLIACSVPNEGGMIPATDSKEALVRVRACNEAAVITYWRRTPATIRRGRVPYPRSAVPG